MENILKKENIIKEVDLNSLIKNTEEFDEQVMREYRESNEKYLKYKIERFRKDDTIKVRIFLLYLV